MKILCIPVIVVLGAVVGQPFNADARNNPVLYTFGGYPTDGTHPLDTLVQGSDGNFYGTTSGGGSNNAGIVFTITTQGTFSALHLFNGDDGYGPWAGLVQGTDSNFYGTTEYGGVSNAGGVFQITSAGTLTLLHSFSGFDGQYPLAGLVQGTDSKFYGTTSAGGTNGAGTVFKMTAQGTLTTLYQFSGGSDGSNIWAGLVQGSDGNFYGTAKAGGTNGAGTVFKMTAEGTLTTLYQFNGSDGDAPLLGSLVQGSDSNFYGTTSGGGAHGVGIVFRISSSGTLTTLYSFAGPDGNGPSAGLAQGLDGKFYGTTFYGGTSTNCAGGCGTAFQITSAGALTVLYSFSGSDGSSIRAGLTQGIDSNVYGTASYGGTNDEGTVFKLFVPFPNSWISAGGGNWEVGTNWSLGAAPSTADVADYVTNAATKTVTIDATTTNTPSALFINNLYIAGTANSTNTLFLDNVGTNTPLQVLGNVLALDTNGALVVNNSAILATNSDSMIGNTGGGTGLTITNGGALYDDHGFVGSNSTSSGNSVLVAGVGSVWSNSNELLVGISGWGNSLIISNGGTVYDSYGELGPTIAGSNNTVLVAGAGSVWTNQSFVDVAEYSSGNSLVISNGGAVYSSDGSMGWEASSSNNTVLITGAGSVWQSQTYFYVGRDGCGNVFDLAGGTVIATNVTVGFSNSASNNTLMVTGGSLFVTNALGNGGLVVSQAGGADTFFMDGGEVTVNSLVATNGANSVVTFKAGLLASGGTFVTNSRTFVVGGVGPNAATFQLSGGVHSFADGMEVRSNSTLSGCGTINGNVTVDTGGTVLANCGGNLDFFGTVTNNATVLAVDGTTINFYGPVVNNGVINATNGGAQFYGGIVSTGSILNSPGTNSWIDGNGKWENSNNWSLAVAPSTTDLASLIANGGNDTVTIDATTTGALAGATMTISNLILSANTLALDNAGTNIPLQVLGQFQMTNGASLLITNSAMQIYGGPLVPIANGNITLLSGSFTIGSNTLALGSVGNTSTLSLAGGTATMGGLDIGVSGNGTGTVLVTGGTLFVTNATGTGQLSLYNGSFALSNGATVVADTYTNIGGTFTNLGGTFIINSQATVNQGTNTFSGGTTQIGSNLTVASTGGSTGTVAVTGGSLIATNATTTIGGGSNSVASIVVSSNATMVTSLTSLGVGSNSTASLTLQGTATMQVLSNLTAGSGIGSTASVSIAGGQLTATNGVIGIGNDGSTTNGFGYGQMTVSNSSVLANQILLGSSAGGHGDLTIQPNGMVSIVGSNALLVPDGVTIDGGELDIDNGQIACGIGTGSSSNFTGTLTMLSGTANCMVIYVGDTSAGTLTISGGQMSVSPLMDIGYSSGSAGSVWMSGGMLTAGAIILGDSGIGQLSLSNNGIIQVSSSFSVGASGAAGAAGTLTVAGGSLTSSVPVYVGAGSVWVSGGQLQAPSLLIGYNNYGVGKLTISNGSVQANSLILTNLANSQFALVGGTLESGGTVVTNTHLFVVGNSINAATFAMAGGTHWFANGLEVANNATLTGCGTINGTVTIDAGAHAVATCGTVTFGNTVTINGNGVVRALNGSMLSFSGPVVNNGAIDVLDGSATFSSPPTGTGYILTTNCLPVITSIQRVGSDIHVSFTTGANAPYAVNYKTDMITGTWTILTNVTGTGGANTVIDSGAALQPKRFYQVNLVVPP